MIASVEFEFKHFKRRKLKKVLILQTVCRHCVDVCIVCCVFLCLGIISQVSAMA